MIKILIIAISLMFASLSAEAAQILAADKAGQRANAKQIYLVDIRRPDEWKRSGVAKPAHTISMHRKGFVQKLNKLTGGNKDAPIALMCATGIRSTWMAGELEKRGYTNVINVGEGMMGSKYGPGWLKRGLPIRNGG